MAVWTDKFIQPNQYSRPQQKLTAVRKIVMHWTANFGATAEGHFRYFNTLSGRYASAHLFVDKLQALCIVPLNEITYHANDGTYKGVAELKPNANFLSIGIELCVEKDGTFHPDTIAKAVDVAVELCKRYGLDPMTDIVRHYDITRKSCPAPWVTNSAPFVAFKKQVDSKMNPAPAPAPVVKPVSAPKAKSHTVEKGETFYAIANKYDMTVTELQKFNPRVEASKLQVGDVIYLYAVPVAEAKPVAKPVVKPVVKPVAKPIAKPVEKPIGNVVIETSSLNIRSSASLEAKVVGQAIRGAKFPVYEQKNGMLRIGVGKWISAKADYSKYTPIVVAKYHTVKSGDTVSELAVKYGSTVAQLKSWNKLDSKYTLQLGQKLRVK